MRFANRSVNSRTARLVRRAAVVGLVLGAFGCPLAGNGRASEILIDPDHDSVSANTYYPTFDQIAGKMLDNSGLSSPLPNGSAVPASDSAYPSHDTTPVNEYRSGKDTHPDLVFTLDRDYALSALHYWNFNADNRASHPTGGTRETPGDGVNSVDIAVSTTALAGPYTTVGTYTFQQAPGLDTYTGVTLPLGQTVDAKFVRFHVNTNFSPGSDGNYFGLAELRFIGTPVPEPAAVALLASGGILLLARRRRALV